MNTSKVVYATHLTSRVSRGFNPNFDITNGEISALVTLSNSNPLYKEQYFDRIRRPSLYLAAVTLPLASRKFAHPVF